MLANEILDFWFGRSDEELRATVPKWWKKDDALDEEIRTRFAIHIPAAKRGEFSGWEAAPDTTCALVVLLDQFSRNAFRGTPQAFAQDEQARGITHRAIEKGFDRQVHPVWASLLYIPFMHAEDRDLQERSIACYTGLADRAPSEWAKSLRGNLKAAHDHKAIIDRFGRYPHRNQILGRETTDEERTFLQQPGSSF